MRPRSCRVASSCSPAGRKAHLSDTVQCLPLLASSPTLFPLLRGRSHCRADVPQLAGKPSGKPSDNDISLVRFLKGRPCEIAELLFLSKHASTQATSPSLHCWQDSARYLFLGQPAVYLSGIHPKEDPATLPGSCSSATRQALRPPLRHHPVKGHCWVAAFQHQASPPVLFSKIAIAFVRFLIVPPCQLAVPQPAGEPPGYLSGIYLVKFLQGKSCTIAG